MANVDSRQVMRLDWDGTNELVIFSGTVIENRGSNAADWERFESRFTLNDVAWTQIDPGRIIPVVSLAAVSAEGGSTEGWAIDRTRAVVTNSRIQIICNIAVRGRATLIRMSYQVSAWGNVA